MHNEVQIPNDWARAATLAHKILTQTITDEELDELADRQVIEADPAEAA